MASFSGLLQQVQINSIFTDNERIFSCSCNVKKVQNNCQIVWKEQIQVSFSIVSSITSELTLLPFLTITRHKPGTRTALQGPWLDNTEVLPVKKLVMKRNYPSQVRSISDMSDLWAILKTHKVMKRSNMANMSGLVVHK